MAQSKETKRLVRFIAEEATRYNFSQADLAERSGRVPETLSPPAPIPLAVGIHQDSATSACVTGGPPCAPPM